MRSPHVVTLAVSLGLVHVGAARPALAGRTHYGWLPATEVSPERGVELETWITELDNVGTADRDKTELLWSPTLGLTDQLELGLPIELSWVRVGGMPGATALDRWGVEARYRFASSDPVDAPPWVPLVRVAVKREVDERRAVTLEADAVLSYECGRWHAAAGVSASQLFHSGPDVTVVRPLAGASYGVTDSLRLGLEVVSTLVPRGVGPDWTAVGPNLGFTHGRFWVAASLPLGVSNVDTAPRVRWGIAF
ncbi:MAG: hypothetical protein R3B48_21345 [Kofleriaceae bacterium]